MINDGAELLDSCLLVLFSCMHASHFLESMSTGLITTVDKSGLNCGGIITALVLAKLFAVITEHRLPAWAERHAVKAKGQAGFRQDCCTTFHILNLRSLIE